MLDITGYSLAMYSTHLFHHPSRILFDCGEGISLSMRQKVFAINSIFLSHSHHDHTGGILSLLLTRNSAKGDNSKPLNIYYPKNSHYILEQIKYVKNVLSQTNYLLEWIPLDAWQEVCIGKNKFVQCFPTKHVKDELTLGYQLYEIRKQLKKEYVGKLQSEIIALKQSGNDITDSVKYAILTISGDTIPLENYGKYPGGTFMHEATLLTRDDLRYDVHSCLEDVIERSKNLSIDALCLYHFSSRYSLEQIQEKLSGHNISFPLYYMVEDKIFEVKNG